MTSIADIRARLRKDLHDEDSANHRWTDGELDRHIQHTVREFSLTLPLEVKTALATTISSPSAVRNARREARTTYSSHHRKKTEPKRLKKSTTCALARSQSSSAAGSSSSPSIQTPPQDSQVS